MYAPKRRTRKTAHPALVKHDDPLETIDATFEALIDKRPRRFVGSECEPEARRFIAELTDALASEPAFSLEEAAKGAREFNCRRCGPLSTRGGELFFKGLNPEFIDQVVILETLRHRYGVRVLVNELGPSLVLRKWEPRS